MPKQRKDKQQAFIENYLATWNATQSAKRAGYSERTAYSIGHELLKKPEVQAEIQRRLSDLQMNADEVKTRLASQARGTIEDYGEVDKYGHFSLDLNKAQQNGSLANIKKLKPTRYGYELELHDAQAALVHVGKIHGLFIDKTEHSGPEGGPIVVKKLKGKTTLDKLIGK